MTTFRYKIDGIDCANCAKELEEEIGKLSHVSNCTLAFGIHSYLTFDYDGDDYASTEKAMIQIIEDDQENPIITRIDAVSKTYKYKIDGIDCAACAKELEEEIGKLSHVSNCTLAFGIHSYLTFDYDGDDYASTEKAMIQIIEDDQENPIITRIEEKKTKTYKYNIKNIDCADCANELAEKTEKIAGVEGATADFMQQTLSFTCVPKNRSRIEKEMIAMIAKSEPEVEVSVFEPLKKEVVEDKKDYMLIRLVVGAVLFVAGFFLNGLVGTGVVLAAYLVLGYDVLLKAIRNIGRGQLFDENFLMSVATIAALYLGDFDEAAGVMLFYQIGEYFQERAVERSRKNIGDLMDIRPEYANVKCEDGSFSLVQPDEVGVDDIIQVKPGERIPLDGVIVSGASSLDTASLTGESKPRDVDVNDGVLSGSVNQTGVLEIRVTKEYGESTVSRILKLVENNDTHAAKQEKFISKFSHYYTPIVVIAAIITAIVVSFMYGDINVGIARACTFLVISCPCALVISIPLSFFAGIGGLSSRGILVKGADVVDGLASIEQIIFDKTGTLTSGKFAIEEVLHTEDEKQLKFDAAVAEHFSNHPIAQGIKEAVSEDIDENFITDVKEIAGRGLQVTYKGQVILAGNAKLMNENQIDFVKDSAIGTLVYVAKDGKYEGCLVLRDQLKEDATSAIREIHEEGKKSIIVSGDNQDVTNQIASKLSVDQAIGGCMPEDKVDTVVNLMKNGKTAFVGDGVNDAPVITCADVGFAMGGIGSDAAIEAADVVLMDDSVSKVALAIRASKRILKIANENIYGAILIKLIILVLGAFGKASMWLAIFADTGVAMICVLNSMRLLRIARKK